MIGFTLQALSMTPLPWPWLTLTHMLMLVLTHTPCCSERALQDLRCPSMARLLLLAPLLRHTFRIHPWPR